MHGNTRTLHPEYILAPLNAQLHTSLWGNSSDTGHVLLAAILYLVIQRIPLENTISMCKLCSRLKVIAPQATVSLKTTILLLEIDTLVAQPKK